VIGAIARIQFSEDIINGHVDRSPGYSSSSSS
jgi:hypothetical protein